MIPVLDVGEWDDRLVLVMPRAEMSLQQRLAEPIELAECIDVLTQIAAALADVGSRVVHRDLKPANVLMWHGRWRLANFGIARYADASTAPETRKFALTPPYAAPEQWQSEHATAATDVYAWFEMAFMGSPLLGHGPPVEPFPRGSAARSRRPRHPGRHTVTAGCAGRRTG
ncbi:MAG: protein kinase domain-containing protein [Dermatophilaceae bacterium]